MTTTLLTNPHKKMKMKKIIFLLTALLLAAPSAFAHDFSVVVPSGQTLYFNIVNGNEVEVTYPGSNNNYTYSGYTKPTGNLTIPSTVTNESITYSVTSISNDAFHINSDLISVTIPSSVTSIAEYAFRYCRHLTAITIPSKVASIGSESFYGCYDLAEITLLAAIPPSIGNTTFQYVPTDIPVHIPCGSLAAYQASNRWSSFTNFIEGDVFPYTLTVTSAHSAMGSADVTVAPTCTNNSATIAATPNSGYLFDHWSDGNSDNPRTLTVTQDTSLTAIFGIGATTDTAIHIHMELVGDSLFTQESQSMVVTHPDSTYVKLRFDVEPAAERVEVLDQTQNVVATFLDATEEHVFRLTTGLYTIRAVFPGGATFEGTIDFVNELQE